MKLALLVLLTATVLAAYYVAGVLLFARRKPLDPFEVMGVVPATMYVLVKVLHVFP
jgi:hypothetical protein